MLRFVLRDEHNHLLRPVPSVLILLQQVHSSALCSVYQHQSLHLATDDERHVHRVVVGHLSKRQGRAIVGFDHFLRHDLLYREIYQLVALLFEVRYHNEPIAEFNHVEDCQPIQVVRVFVSRGGFESVGLVEVVELLDTFGVTRYQVAATGVCHTVGDREDLSVVGVLPLPLQVLILPEHELHIVLNQVHYDLVAALIVAEDQGELIGGYLDNIRRPLV